jgi:hypothetical protein
VKAALAAGPDVFSRPCPAAVTFGLFADDAAQQARPRACPFPPRLVDRADAAGLKSDSARSFADRRPNASGSRTGITRSIVILDAATICVAGPVKASLLVMPVPSAAGPSMRIAVRLRLRNLMRGAQFAVGGSAATILAVTALILSTLVGTKWFQGQFLRRRAC